MLLKVYHSPVPLVQPSLPEISTPTRATDAMPHVPSLSPLPPQRLALRRPEEEPHRAQKDLSARNVSFSPERLYRKIIRPAGASTHSVEARTARTGTFSPPKLEELRPQHPDGLSPPPRYHANGTGREWPALERGGRARRAFPRGICGLRLVLPANG